MKFLLCIVLLSIFSEIICDDDLVVNITKPFGGVRGHVLKTATGKEYYAFQEIPYAQPPIGRHRLTLPKKHNDWHVIRNITQTTKICMQTLKENPFKLNVTEDCLYLNIYTPQLPTQNNGTLLPVLIWIHPGNFMEGAGVFQYYNPQYIIEYGVIVVTINYRLGPFGFLWPGDEIIPGNLGLRDQIFAFYWLFTNIKAFGGDPFHMALVGQGSGAASIGYHFINKRARATLFFCAIMMSGSCVSPQYYQPDAKQYAFTMAKKLNSKFNSNSTTELRDFLRTIPAESILQKSDEIVEENSRSKAIFEKLVWLPVTEGYMNFNPYIVWPMLEAWSDGNVRITSALLGFTSGEMTSWASKNDLNGLAERFDKDPSTLINYKINIPPEKRKLAGEEMKLLYTNKTFKEDHAALIRYLNDQMTTPVIKQAYNSSWYNYNYMYKFSYKGKMDNNVEKDDLEGTEFFDNVPHGSELKYIWDDGTNSDPSKFSPEDKLMQKRLLTLWTNFIKYRNPTPTEDELFNNTKWLSNRNDFYQSAYLNIGRSLKNDEHPPGFQEINDLLDKYVEHPIAVY